MKVVIVTKLNVFAQRLQDEIKSNQDRLAVIKSEIDYLMVFQETTRPAIVARINSLENSMRHNQSSIERSIQISRESDNEYRGEVNEELEIFHFELHDDIVRKTSEIFILTDEIELKRIKLEDAISERNMCLAAISILEDRLRKMLE